MSRELSLYMNLFQSQCFRWRPAFRSAGFWESATASTAFVSGERDRSRDARLVHLQREFLQLRSTVLRGISTYGQHVTNQKMRLSRYAPAGLNERKANAL
jgi:hypothetical protein